MITIIFDMLKKAFSKGLLHMFSANYLTQILAFGSILFVSKVLSPAELGAVKIIQSYVAVCITFAMLGKTTAIIKFCAETKEIVQRENMLRFSVISSLIASIVLITALNIVNLMGGISQDPVVTTWMPWYSLAILFSAFYAICITYMQACKEFKRMATIQSGVKIFSVAVVVIVTNQYGLQGYILAVLFTLMLSVMPFMHQIGINFLFKKSLPLPKGFQFLANVGIVSSVVGTLSMYVDIFFLDHFISDRSMVGFYALATILIIIGTQFVGTIQGFLTPFFSEHSYDGAWLWAATKKYQRYLVFGAGGLACGIYALGEILVHFYYGVTYESTLLFLSILLCRFFFYSGYAIFGIALQSINKEQYNCGVAIFSLILRCFLSYVFLSEYGIIGLAIAQALNELVVVIIQYKVTYRVFQRHFGADIMRCS